MHDGTLWIAVADGVLFSFCLFFSSALAAALEGREHPYCITVETRFQLALSDVTLLCSLHNTDPYRVGLRDCLQRTA